MLLWDPQFITVLRKSWHCMLPSENLIFHRITHNYKDYKLTGCDRQPVPPKRWYISTRVWLHVPEDTNLKIQRHEYLQPQKYPSISKTVSSTEGLPSLHFMHFVHASSNFTFSINLLLLQENQKRCPHQCRRYIGRVIPNKQASLYRSILNCCRFEHSIYRMHHLSHPVRVQRIFRNSILAHDTAKHSEACNFRIQHATLGLLISEFAD